MHFLYVKEDMLTYAKYDGNTIYTDQVGTTNKYTPINDFKVDEIGNPHAVYHATGTISDATYGVMAYADLNDNAWRTRLIAPYNQNASMVLDQNRKPIIAFGNIGLIEARLSN